MNSISELKKIIHPLNTSVADFDIKMFDAVILDIWQSHKHLAPVITLLKMIRSLVLYLISKKSAAHMDTLPILKDLIHQLEHIITTPSLEREKMDEILSSRLEDYKIFQNKIISNPDMDIQDMDELKAVILAIDWEISEKTLHHFDRVVLQVLNKLRPYKIHHTFLKMIHSIGRFIGIQKADAPTDSISFLRSLFEHLQEIIQKKDMSFDEKKKLLEKDISRFNDFKIRISKSREKSQKKSEEKSKKKENTIILENDDILPALSHLKSSKTQMHQDHMSLTCLPEEDSSLLNEDMDSENIKPALTNKQKTSKTPTDVMDDLFTVKESPADELLDAIHLMEIQGSSDPSSPARQMFDKEDAFESDGVKKFITQKKDNAPIAEINSRLDEFFNLEAPTDSYPQPLESKLSETKADAIADDMADSMDTDAFIVPFDDEDETYEESGSSKDDLKQMHDLSSDETLKRLEHTLKNENWLTDNACLDLIYEDVLFLKKAWEKDAQKTCLLEIVINTVSLLKDKHSGKISSENSHTQPPEFDSDPDITQKSYSGFWGKLKSIFNS